MRMTPALLAEQLVRVASGDRAAFATVYQATSAKLYGIILRISMRRDVADELLQDVYVKIWERARDFDPSRASPITWMATIARNRALDEARKTRPQSLDQMPEALEIKDPGMLASDRLEIVSEIERLNHCLEQLDPQRRDIVKLAYLDGLSREELSERFGHPVATIKTWLHRSLKQLKTCLSS
jgi:RNA polymerase sigma-70 factor (ECF subfamily)